LGKDKEVKMRQFDDLRESRNRTENFCFSISLCLCLEGKRKETYIFGLINDLVLKLFVGYILVSYVINITIWSLKLVYVSQINPHRRSFAKTLNRHMRTVTWQLAMCMHLRHWVNGFDGGNLFSWRKIT